MNAQVSPEFLPEAHKAFDPLQELFVAQASRPAHWSEVNLRALTPYQRALLMIDGTVTKFIEAYTLEPVEVLRLSQFTQRLAEYHCWLAAQKEAHVMVREVLLRSRYGRTPLAYAVSLIMPERLQPAVRRGLEGDGQSLGRLLLDCQVETRRELLWYGRERSERLPEDLRHLSGRELLARTYRIIAQGQPIMLINEKFLAVHDALPAHH